jgi:pimeloyl-ACP methyl ester carboxylesterase
MRLMVDGVETYASTGGRAHAAGKPWIVFLHGAGFSHLSWVLQGRALAYDGYNVLAPDFPGHNLSSGEPLTDIAALAAWTLKLMDAAGCEQGVIAGHSMGGLVALEIARTAPQRVRGLVMVATAAEIPVNAGLLDMAANRQDKAIASMVSWAHGPQAHLHENTWPGASHVFYSIDTMELNAPQALPRDLNACADYSGGAEAAAGVQCPALCIFSPQDRMTPMKAGLKLASLLPRQETVIVEGGGHTIPTERPREVNAALRRFLAALPA